MASPPYRRSLFHALALELKAEDQWLRFSLDSSIFFEGALAVVISHLDLGYVCPLKAGHSLQESFPEWSHAH